MKSKFVKTTFRGFLYLIPIIGIVYFFNQFYQWTSVQVKKVIDTTPLNSTLEVLVLVILAVVVLFVMGYIMGRISYTKLVTTVSKWLDEQLLTNISAYRAIKLQIDNSSSFILEDHPPVFVRFGESERPGFLMEEKTEMGKCVVFIPKNFNDFNGHVYIVPMENVRKANSDQNEFVIALDHLGVDLDIS